MSAAAWQPREERAKQVGARMLPDNHPEVQAYLARVQRRQRQKNNTGHPGGRKLVWKAKHQACLNAVRPVEVVACPNSMGDPAAPGHLPPRTREAWQILSKLFRHGELTADLSQSIARAGTRRGGSCPNITPRGFILD